MSAQESQPSPGLVDKAPAATPLRAVELTQTIVQPTARAARIKPRHRMAVISFFLCALLPIILAVGYLYLIATDQYASRSAFSVRKESVNATMSLLGGLTNLSSGTSDIDVIYEYIQSQGLVDVVDKKLDLRKKFSANYAHDPWFSLKENAPIEDLVSYWNRMVSVQLDQRTGIIRLETRAFTAADAQAVNTEILQQSSLLIENLSRITQNDAIRFSKDEFDQATERLRKVRLEIAALRRSSRMIDPNADLQSQMGVLNRLEGDLAAALVEQDLLQETSSKNDPRLLQLERRIRAIRNRIEAERQALANQNVPDGLAVDGVIAIITNEAADAITDEPMPAGDANNNVGAKPELTSMFSTYEALLVDQQFAERAYVSALASYDEALAEARRKSRYLATHIMPTLAEEPQYPQRLISALVASTLILLLWVLGILIAYSIRDRR
jgi:capsular polysaccharide transport system permease protein